MHTLICDLTARTVDGLQLSHVPDTVIAREDLEAAGACCGRMRCRTECPGRCVMPDSLQGLADVLRATDRLDIIARWTPAGASPLVKRAVDRSLPFFMAPRATERTLHLCIWLYGAPDPAERMQAARAIQALARDLALEVDGIWFPASIEDAGRTDLTRAEHQSDPASAGNVCEVAPARGSAPERIALINASPKTGPSATAHLLVDFADALGAYTRLSGSPQPAINDIVCGRDGSLRASGFGQHGDAEGVLAQCDTIVIGYPLYFGSLPSHLLAWLEGAADARTFAPQANVYAICNLASYDPERALPSFAALESLCRHAGLAWCGGLTAAGGAMILPASRSPRMGTWRRKRSEAIDALIAAVRLGETVSEAAERIGRTACAADPDAILARCPLPRPVYRIAARRLWLRSPS